MSTLYTTVETQEPVKGVNPALITRFQGRAERRCARLNANLRIPFFRWEVYERSDGKWLVIAMQNLAVPVERNNGTT